MGREAEINKLRKDLEEANIQKDSTMVNLKRKHQDAITEMTEQIDQLKKVKDKKQISTEMTDVRAATDEINRAKASAEKSNKVLTTQLNDTNKRVEEANLTLTDFEGGKRKLAAENADLLRQVQELENSASMLQKVRIQLQSQLDEVKRNAEDESRERLSLLGKYKNLEHEVDGLHFQFD